MKKPGSDNLNWTTCFYLFILLAMFSCKDFKKVEVNVDENVEEKFEKVNNELVECIFDQKTQTDDFLINIESLRGYSWVKADRTATLTLKDGANLKIYRGGCDDFQLSATFEYDRKLTLTDDRDFVFSKIIWITSLLDEFDGDIIRKAINDTKISITEEEENKSYVNFMDERVYESYFMYHSIDNGITTFSIAYNLN